MTPFSMLHPESLEFWFMMDRQAMGFCHHSMACPWVVGGGDGLQMWRVAANILNKKLWTASKGWLSALGVGQGLNSLL